MIIVLKLIPQVEKLKLNELMPVNFLLFLILKKK
jgi:hypothetical protein